MITIAAMKGEDGNNHLIAQGHPVEFNKEAILSLLRTIKQGFPDFYRQVHYELVIPANGSQPEIPEEFKR